MPLSETETPLPVHGIGETSLYVADLDRSQQFYERVLGFEPLFTNSSRIRALRIPGRQVLLLFRVGATAEDNVTSGGIVPGHDARGTMHVAFAIGRDEIPAWEQRLGAAGVAVESRVTWPPGGISLYFRDPDGHSVELMTPGVWRGL